MSEIIRPADGGTNPTTDPTQPPKTRHETAMAIRNLFARNRQALELRPSVGRKTATTKVRMLDGVACQIEEGKWTLRVDMGTASGGADSGPNPGILGRGAFGTCLAMGYATWAARWGIELRSLEVEVQADMDSGAYYGTSDAPPGYLAVRYVVHIESDAPEEELIRMLDDADAHSAYLDVFRRDQNVSRTVNLVSGNGRAGDGSVREPAGQTLSQD